MSDETNPGEKPMPSSEAAERNVLAYVLQTGSFADAGALVDASEFYHPLHRTVFTAMAVLDKQGRPIDDVTIGDVLREEEKAKMAAHYNGLSGFLASVLGDLDTLDHLEEHAAIVRRKAERRRWIAASRELAIAGYGDVEDDTYVTRAEQRLLELVSGRKGARGPVALNAALREWMHHLQEVYEAKKAGARLTGLPTGLGMVDDMLAGLQPGDLYLLGARPAMGKTALALNITQAAAQAGAHGLIFSVEMSRFGLIDRMVAGDGRVNSRRLQAADLDTAHWVRVAAATTRLAELPIWIDDDSTVTIADIRSRARRWRSREAAKQKALVVVDYAQLVEAAEKRQKANREQEVSEVSRNLKLMAKELECPVLALAQLNRGLESREDKRPKQSDLRDSGSLEQDADVIAFLYRDEVYHSGCKDFCQRCDENHGVAEFIVAKNRKGATGMVRLAWVPDYTKFETLSERVP